MLRISGWSGTSQADTPGAQALRKDGLPVIIIAVSIYAAHVVAWIEGIVILRAGILAGEFGFSDYCRLLVEDIEKFK